MLVPTDDGSFTMRHTGHGECFHSQLGAELESRSLYVGASGIEARFARGAARTGVLDVGLGLGYNALVTVEAWLGAAAPGDLSLTSLEIDSELVAALASGAAPWQAGWSEDRRARARLLVSRAETAWTATLPHPSGSRLDWHVFVGDATFEDAAWARAADAPFDFVWQDAFSPANNAPLWSEAWFARVRARCADGAVLMTYSVAGAVRGALAAAGFRWTKIPTPHPRKRNWLRAEASSC